MLLLKSILIGLSIAAPVGPIGVLCIQRTLTFGQRIGMISGLGAASADAVYGFIAAFGLAFIMDLLTSGQNVLRIVGGLFLVYLGVRTLMSRSSAQETSAAPVVVMNPFQAYLSTFALTITNPATIIAFVAIFAGLGISQSGGGYGDATITVIGVFTGSALWWLMLSLGVSFIGKFTGPRFMIGVNWFSGVILVGFGMLAVGSVIL